MRLRCNRGRLGRSADQGAGLSASGRGGESRSPPRYRRDTTVRSGPSKSFGIYFDSRTPGSSGWPLVPMAGPPRWAVDSAGGSKSANPPGSGFPRGASPGCELFLCWCGRSGGAPTCLMREARVHSCTRTPTRAPSGMRAGMACDGMTRVGGHLLGTCHDPCARERALLGAIEGELRVDLLTELANLGVRGGGVGGVLGFARCSARRGGA